MSDSGDVYRHPGEEFQFYVERQFNLLFQRELSSFNLETKSFLNIQNRLEKLEEILIERFTKMATLAEQLGVEETTLAEVVPQLATEITSLQTSLATKETELNNNIAKVGADTAELTAKNSELAAIQKVQESLAPIVEKAKGLVPAPAAPATPPAETPPSEAPPVSAETPTPVNPNEG
jgi:hypothetical protein